MHNTERKHLQGRYEKLFKRTFVGEVVDGGDTLPISAVLVGLFGTTVLAGEPGNKILINHYFVHIDEPSDGKLQLEPSRIESTTQE